MKRCETCGRLLMETEFDSVHDGNSGKTFLRRSCSKCTAMMLNPMPIRKCRVCGRLFKGKESQRFCSTSCKKAGRAERRRAARMTKPEAKVSTAELKEKMRRRWLASVE